MPVKMCDSMQAWLDNRNLTPPPEALVRHVRECAACQAVLVEFAATSMQLG